jgi:hypothetical protein
MILALTATKIASGACQREACAAGMKVVERLLLHGIHRQCTWVSVDFAIELAAYIPSAMAQTGFSLGDTAMMRA